VTGRRWWLGLLMVVALMVVALIRVGTGYVAWHACGYRPIAAVTESVGHFGAAPSWLECLAAPSEPAR
jgi:hypothetical protein